MNALDHDLLTAARTGDTEGVRTAIEGGARVDVRDDELRTLSSSPSTATTSRRPACSWPPGRTRTPRTGARRVRGWPPGSPAVSRCCGCCSPAGPDLTLRNRFGGVSLVPASERGHVAYVREVLRVTDIDVDHVNRLGWTALLEAVILGEGGLAHQQVVELLLAAGATRDLPDGDGVTPLAHAERRGFAELAALLRDAA